MPKLLYGLYGFFKSNQLVLWLSLTVFFLLAGWLSSRLVFEEDISMLIPQSEENEELQTILKNTKFADKIVVRFKKDGDGNSNDLKASAERFLDSIEKDSLYVESIQGVVKEDEAFELLDFIYEHLPLFLTSEDYEHIEKKLNNDSIKAFVDNNYKIITSPSGAIAKQIILRDPLGFSILASNHLKQLAGSNDFKVSDGFLISQNEQHLLLFITPIYSTRQTNENAPFLKHLKVIQEHLNQEFQSKVNLSLYGGAFIAFENANQIKSDIQLTLSIALAVLLIVFVIFYRNLFIPLILFLPTVCGGLLALAILSLIKDSISAISLGIGAILLGVTLDYSLHLLTHIRNRESIRDIYETVAKPILVSALTTALAFLCLLFIGSPALQDLGLFAAISVLSSALFALILIPQYYRPNETTPRSTTILDRVSAYRPDKNRPAVFVVLGIFLLSLFFYNNVEFNQDLESLNYKSQSLQNAERNLDTLLHTQSKSLYAVAFGDELQTALKANDRLLPVLMNLKAKQLVSDFNSVAVLVSSDSTQRAKLQHWSTFWNQKRVDETTSKIDSFSIAKGFKPQSFQEFDRLLTSQFSRLELSDYSKYEIFNTKDFVSPETTPKTVANLIKTGEKHMDQVEARVAELDNIKLIDRKAMNESLLENLESDFNQLIILCSLVVTLLLWVYYGTIKLTLVTVLPIILTWLLTVGVMGMFNLEFNVFNIIICTFIFGLGVDYCIFITNGLRHENQFGSGVLAIHKTSVLLSLLTTILGIGVLVFAKHPALKSIALVSVIGIFSAVIIAFTIQPLLFKLLIFRKRNLP